MNNESAQAPRGFFKQSLFNAMVNGSNMSLWKRKWVYLTLTTFLLVILWAPALLVVLMSQPTFTSKWTLILPGAGAGHAVSLESIGQTSANISSPYAGTSMDPKVNYKAIAESQPVLQQAAQKLDLTLQQFGKPKIKLVDQSTLIYFSMSAESAELAREKAIVLHEALMLKLDWLRNDESMHREKAIRNMLSGFNDKLAHTQKNILDFQSSSSIVSLDQFKELTFSIERLRSTHSELLAELSGLEQQVNSLGKTLGLDPMLAADAMALQQDQVFQSQLASYAEASVRLNSYSAKWGDNHPKLIDAKEQKKRTRSALLKRSKLLLRKSLGVEQLLTLGINDNRSGLFQELVTLHTKAVGMRSHEQTLSEQTKALQQRLEETTGEAASLGDLNRKQQVATAVFTNALAKMDIGKSDAFASYPLLQMLSEPTLPESPDKLKKVLALGGAAIGSLFCLIALGLLWIRKPYLRRILTRN
jgi:uncharacterized protein involved in exopolysaccharide biosynthesis